MTFREFSSWIWCTSLLSFWLDELDMPQWRSSMAMEKYCILGCEQLQYSGVEDYLMLQNSSESDILLSFIVHLDLALQRWPKVQVSNVCWILNCFGWSSHPASSHITSLVVWSSWICPCTSNYIQGNSLPAISAVLTWYSHNFFLDSQAEKMAGLRIHKISSLGHWTL